MTPCERTIPVIAWLPSELMTKFEQLPVDQAATLRLVIAGRDYDAVSSTLGIKPAEVERRAKAGLEALAGDQASALTEGERDEIADVLLGQREHSPLLDGSPTAQTYAATIRAELPQQAKSMSENRQKSQAPKAAADSTHEAHPASVSRRGGIALIGGALVLILVITLWATGSFDSGSSTTADSAATTTTPSTSNAKSSQQASQTKFVPGSKTQYPLRATPNGKELGRVLLGTKGSQPALALAAIGNPADTYVGVWLTGPNQPILIGLQKTNAKGEFAAEGLLPNGAAKQTNLIVTREVYSQGGALPNTPGQQLLSTAFVK